MASDIIELDPDEFPEEPLHPGIKFLFGFSDGDDGEVYIVNPQNQSSLTLGVDDLPLLIEFLSGYHQSLSTQ